MELLTFVLLIIIAILLFFLLKKERVLGINTEVKIIEAQIGSILKETDIVRYQDVYGRVKN